METRNKLKGFCNFVTISFVCNWTSKDTTWRIYLDRDKKGKYLLAQIIYYDRFVGKIYLQLLIRAI